MFKTSIITALLCVAFAVPASADIKKGQRAYLKQCKKCHGNGTKGAALKSQAEWAEAFADNAKVFKEWHK
ncbi:MAG: c-type cytochrome, partial [Thiovulaceae bacterium]|nr:c-type cytochrome [Sulfurimonadaceae bacterium]